MLVLETIAKIRRAFFVQGKSIKLICRELGVSRKVVRKVIRSEATEFRYEREAQPLPKIGPWTDQLDELLLANEGKDGARAISLGRFGSNEVLLVEFKQGDSTTDTELWIELYDNKVQQGLDSCSCTDIGEA